MVTIMEQVVERGTGKQARLPGHTVAGKTGTAAMIVGGRYSDTDYYASFVGFLPSRQPSLVILVVIDNPHAGRHYGGDVAAPVFHKIAAAAVRHLGIAPSVNPPGPVLVQATPAPAPAMVQAANTGTAPRLDVVAGPPTVPDVRGLAAREAIRRLARLGLVARLTGDGTVIDQDPRAGLPIEPGRVCRLWLERIAAPLPPSPPSTPQ
jgi:membrane peptidoglycan carboxypeptidase